MSRQVQIRRGSATAHTNFTGAIGEITMDTTNKTLRVHDGETVGGIKLAKQSEIPDLTNIDYVVESQLPTAENNYTWYRKYKSGWVEQGGVWNGNLTCATGQEVVQEIMLPVTMANNKFFATATVAELFLFLIGFYRNTTTVNFRFGTYATSRTLTNFVWKIEGLGA